MKYKLDKKPKLKEQYANILCEYEKEGIIEKRTKICEPGNAHNLPHRPVLKENRKTSKVRRVFDGSSKYTSEPSINELLESGPCLLPLLYDILLGFRLEPIAITTDIKQAFLQISVGKERQNFLRFLWFDDIFYIDPSILVYRFSKLIFGLNSSPFLLNVTLKVHFSKIITSTDI